MDNNKGCALPMTCVHCSPGTELEHRRVCRDPRAARPDGTNPDCQRTRYNEEDCDRYQMRQMDAIRIARKMEV